MRKVMTGNHAAAYAVKVCRVQVVAAYPITPQTTVVEKIAQLCAAGEMSARLIKVESEHTSLSACIGASASGARAFTATSSQGLAYMHEMLHWAAGSRLPIVVVNANRALAAPWNLGADHLDSLSQRDTGWMQFYCESNQEVLDTVIQAYRIAEAVSLPAMVSLDGFYLSHTYEPVDVPDVDLVDQYLPSYSPLFRLDPDQPKSSGGATTGLQYTHFRYDGHQAMQRARAVARQAMADFESLFGRRYGLVECDGLENGAEVALVAMGSMAGTIRHAVREMRADGQSVGLAKVRMFRPFPIEELLAALDKVRKIVVIDRDATFDSGGILSQELRAALYGRPGFGTGKPIFGFIAGLGGSDVTADMVRRIVGHVLENESPAEGCLWVEVKR